MKMKLRWVVAAIALAIAPVASSAEALTASQTEARQILRGMAGFLARQKAFSVTSRAAYDAIQSDGQRIEFGDVSKVVLRRPDRLKVDITDSVGDQVTVHYDGKLITAHDVTDEVFAQSEAGSDLDTAVATFVNGLNSRLPLAVLLVNKVAEEIDKRMVDVDYVEYSTVVCRVPCHHLAGKTATTDVQLWVAAGDEPVPLRVVIGYRESRGQPQFRAELSDWNFKPTATDAVFAFKAPAGARKIPYAAQLAAAPAEGDSP